MHTPRKGIEPGGRASFLPTCPVRKQGGEAEGCISRTRDTDPGNKDTGGRRGSHTNALRGFYDFTQASRNSAVPSSPYATGLVSEPSRIWLCALRRGCAAPELGPVAPPRRLRQLAAGSSQAADWVAKEPFGAALVGSAALE